MNYDNLSDEEAAQLLREREDADWSGRTGHEVIEPRDVLYWLDAFGDLSLAINCQGLPKDLPDDVVKEINEWDVLNDWTGIIDETECAICETDIYDFRWKHDHIFINEWGDEEENYEIVNDPANYYWDASGEHYLMCQHCCNPPHFSRMLPTPAIGEVRVFYGETDEFTRFSHEGPVIRWDSLWDWDYEKSIDMFNHRTDDGELISSRDIAASFALGDEREMMERCGFKRIHVKEIKQNVKGVRRFWRYAKEVLEGWATLDSDAMTNEPTHPDLDFTYIIDGTYQAWIPEEHFDKFKAELIWQSLRHAGDSERAKQYREDNDDLLSFDYYGVA